MLDQKKSSGKYRRTKKPRRVQKNNDVPLTTSYLISLLWGALNPLYNGIASLESLSNCFQRLYKFAVGSSLTLDVKFFSVNIQVDPVVEVDDAHVELKSLEYDSETDVTEEEFSKHKSLKHADDKANSPNDSNDECQNNPCDQKNNQENDCQNNVPQNKDPQNKDFQRAKDAKNRMQEQFSDLLDFLGPKIRDNPETFQFLQSIMQFTHTIVNFSSLVILAVISSTITL
ncbi:hypothetical protein C2G38_2053950 [Gigaspora rosea]|uniref:Uncharacterized protein n=1 Tax=Gigaspora rosea TaxID=44941 RepID=A0A397W6L3_9GLOM|nr:hypothetical protein C2G38_2053950 [Gigaspora rosea]